MTPPHSSPSIPVVIDDSGFASSISEGDIFIYLCSAQLTSFEIDLYREINCAEQEYMNMSPSLIELATPLIDESLNLLLARNHRRIDTPSLYCTSNISYMAFKYR